MDSETPSAEDYNANYYASHCGTVPYERNDHWLAFFGGIADRIVATFAPVRVYDAGCALGFLTEALWDRGVECWGRDISTFAISHLRMDVRQFCDVGSIAASPPGPRRFDLAVCIEVVEHMQADEALAALDVLTAAAPRILFSSSPTDLTEPTHVNVRPVIYWLREFAKRGFRPEWTHNAIYVAPHAFVVVRADHPSGDPELQLFAEWIRIRTALVERETRIGGLSEAMATTTAELNTARSALAKSVAELQTSGQAKAALQHSLAELTASRQKLAAALRSAEKARDQLQQELVASSQNQHALRDTIESVGLQQTSNANRATALESTIAELDASRVALKRQLESIQASSFWRASGPLRRILSKYPQLHRFARAIGWLVKITLVWRIPARRRARLQAVGAATPPTTVSPPASTVPDTAPVPTLPAPSRQPEAAPGPSVLPGAQPVVEYSTWIASNPLDPAELDMQRRLVAEFDHHPLVSILTPVYKVEANVLDDTIRSVVDQVYPYWELCLAVGDSSDADRAEVLRRWAASDERIRVNLLAENGGISRNSNAALEMARGEWAVLLDHDDLLTPDALFHLVRAALADADVAMVYSDKDQVGADGITRQHPLFKPAWAPEIMLGANYLTHLNMMRVDRLRSIGGWDPETDGAQDWDLFLRVIGVTGQVSHVPRVLYHWRQVPTSVASGGLGVKPYATAAQLVAVTKYLQTAGWAGASATFDGAALRIAWPADKRPSVSLIMLGRGDAVIPPAYAWSGDVEILAAPPTTTDTAEDAEAGVTDRLAASAHNDILVFVDTGLEPVSLDWLAELVGPLANPAIALVAGAVMRPDGVVEAFGTYWVDGQLCPGFYGLHINQGGPFGHPRWYGNASAAPLRFSAMRRADWRNLTGHRSAGRADLSMTLELAQNRGRIMLNPFAIARAHKPDPFVVTDATALRGRFAAALPDGDPFITPNMVIAQSGWLTFRLVPADTQADHNFAAEARYVAATYDASVSRVAKSIEQCAAAPAGEVRSVRWVVPAFDVPFYGGIYTILRCAEFMRSQHGIKPSFAVLGLDQRRETRDALRAKIARAFPGLAAAAEIDTLRDPADPLPSTPVDALVATLWTTAFPVLAANNARRKFYFLQDWEPLFYPAGSISSLVEATYRFGFHAICNTPTLAESYRSLGGNADHFMPSVDPTVFHPRRQAGAQAGPFRLFCYARPGTPRNAFETLSIALRELKTRHGDKIDIVTAGATWQPQSSGLEGVVRHLGLLQYAETGALYRACDAGLVAMATRHPSYLPFEFMACGAAVITNRSPHTAWLLRDGENAALCELTRSDVVRAVESVMGDIDYRDLLVRGGYETIRERHGDWKATCGAIHTVFSRVCCEPRS